MAKRRSNQEWQALLEQYEISNITQRVFLRTARTEFIYILRQTAPTSNRNTTNASWICQS